MDSPIELRLRLPSRYDDLDLVDQLMDLCLSYVELEEDQRINTGLAIREAAANAVQHGNKLDPEKLVIVEISLDHEFLVVEITDQGPGFDPGAVPDPLAPENILKPSGRGILLIRNFMDEISFYFPEAGGTKLCMRKGIVRSDRKSIKEKRS